MAPLLAPHLRQAAISGDTDALTTILLICLDIRMQHLVRHEYSTILNVVLSNLQLAKHPSTPINLVDPEHRRWMKAAITSLSIFATASQLIADSAQRGRPPPPGQDPYLQVRRHWLSHFWPSLLVIIYNYVTDDHQLPLGGNFTPRETLMVICDLLPFIVTLDEPEEVDKMRSIEGCTECFTSLLVCYIAGDCDWHASIHLLFDVTAGPPAWAVLEGDRRFLPLALSYLQRYARRTLYERDRVILNEFLNFLMDFQSSDSLLVNIEFDLPQIYDVVCQIWKKLLDKPPQPPSKRSWDIWMSCILNCFFLTATRISPGNTQILRRLARRHMFELILKTLVHSREQTSCPNVNGNFSMMYKVLPNFLECVESFLYHLSVLGPIIHALQNVDTQSLDSGPDWQKSRDNAKFFKTWREFRSRVSDRQHVLEAYDRRSVTSTMPPLCGYEAVSAISRPFTKKMS